MKRHTLRHATPRPAEPLTGVKPQKRVTLLRWLLLTFMLAPAGAAFAITPLMLDSTIQRISGSEAPRMVGDVLVLSLKPDHFCRFVGVRFAHEDWNVLHPYRKNEKGVFVLDYPVPEGVREIRYRVVIDGQWMPDPANPRVEADAVGNEFSLYTLEKEPVRPVVSPRREESGAITFLFRGAPGRRVTLVGDFNNWDPLMNEMEETAPGMYSITLRLPAGQHWYCFYSEGRKHLDRYNSRSGLDPDGVTVSYFSGVF
jgi:hypothetical protein